MESWRKTWRDGLAPQISTEALTALRDALANDDARLIQGATTTPPPLMCVQDWPVEAACALSYCGVIDHGGFAEPVAPDGSGSTLTQRINACTVGDAEEYFATRCYECDQHFNDPGSCRWFLNWFDDTPRDEMRRELLAEVRETLAARNS